MKDDEFAKKYLGSENARHSERVTHRAVFALLVVGVLFGITSLGVAIAAAFTQPALFAVAGAGLVAALVSMFFGLFFSTSRIVVGKDELVLHFGRERRIPLASITDAKVVAMGLDSKSRMRREGASDFGARAGRTHAVRIAYTEGSDTKIVYVPSNDPAALASLLCAKSQAKVRVEAGAGAAAAAEPLAELEEEEEDAAGEPARRKA